MMLMRLDPRLEPSSMVCGIASHVARRKNFLESRNHAVAAGGCIQYIFWTNFDQLMKWRNDENRK
jgi:hypothetical protein